MHLIVNANIIRLGILHYYHFNSYMAYAQQSPCTNPLSPFALPLKLIMQFQTH